MDSAVDRLYKKTTLPNVVAIDPNREENPEMKPGDRFETLRASSSSNGSTRACCGG